MTPRQLAFIVLVFGVLLYGFSLKPHPPKKPPSEAPKAKSAAVVQKKPSLDRHAGGDAMQTNVASEKHPANAAAQVTVITATNTAVMETTAANAIPGTSLSAPMHAARSNSAASGIREISNSMVFSSPDAGLQFALSNGYDASPGQRAHIAAALAHSLATTSITDDAVLIRTAFAAGDRFVVLHDIQNALVHYARGLAVASRIVQAVPTADDVLLLSAGTALTNALVPFADNLFIAAAVYDITNDVSFDAIREHIAAIAKELPIDDAVYADAVVRYFALDLAGAQEGFQAILHPERFPSLALYRGLVHLVLGRYDRSFKDLSIAAEAHDRYALYYNRALAGYRSGRTNEALLDLSRAQREKPDEPRIAYDLGTLYRERNDRQKAAYYYMRAVTADPRYSPAAYALGLMYMDMGEYSRAIPYFGAVESNGSASALVVRPALYNNMAVCLLSVRPPENERALAYAERAAAESIALTNSTNWSIRQHVSVLDTRADAFAASRKYADASRTIADAIGTAVSNRGAIPGIQGVIDELEKKRRQWDEQTNH